MEYLMTEILDFDKRPKPAYVPQNVVFVEVYSYLRDRTRACRVDLHLQQPRSTCSKTFVETHEVCLRFEMLSLFLQLGEAAEKGGTEKYDPKLGLKAISQTIEPLLNAYQAVRDKVLAKSILAEVMGDLGAPVHHTVADVLLARGVAHALSETLEGDPEPSTCEFRNAGLGSFHDGGLQQVFAILSGS